MSTDQQATSELIAEFRRARLDVFLCAAICAIAAGFAGLVVGLGMSNYSLFAKRELSFWLSQGPESLLGMVFAVVVLASAVSTVFCFRTWADAMPFLQKPSLQLCRLVAFSLMEGQMLALRL
jgi:hypothetical protein